MTSTVTKIGRCATCSGPSYDNPQDGCTPYTCITPCVLCDHPGDVHRDWYREQHGAGFCRRCRPDEPGYRHDYRPAADRAANLAGDSPSPSTTPSAPGQRGAEALRCTAASHSS